ncbi:unnamed protein product [Lactuca saligna]|uniref:Uncharacterized protein n=1 Tax=Lactuca saligna TaxID=75948 RepID=A0AA36E8B7_LACSI|nr:unnamed protein product [Lactuca saligna]
MEGLIPLLMHAVKKHSLHNSYRVLSLSTGSTGSSHRMTRLEFQPPTAEYMTHRSGFGAGSQSMSFNKGSTSSIPNTYHASKLKILGPISNSISSTKVWLKLLGQISNSNSSTKQHHVY